MQINGPQYNLRQRQPGDPNALNSLNDKLNILKRIIEANGAAGEN